MFCLWLYQQASGLIYIGEMTQLLPILLFIPKWVLKIAMSLTNLHQNPSVPNYILLASAGKRNKEKLLTVSDIYDFGCF